MTKAINSDGSISTAGPRTITIPYLEGLNMSVGSNLSKITEMSFCQNCRSTMIGESEKRAGYTRLGNNISSVGNYGMFYFENNTPTNTGFYRISDTGTGTKIYYLKSNNIWTSLTGDGANLSAKNVFTVEAENCLFYVNGVNSNYYIKADGSTIINSNDSAGHLKGSPKANKIAYYKDKLYAGDYYSGVGGTRFPTSVMFSSKPLGIVSLVDGDQDSGVSSIDVTDTEYIVVNENLDVYRAGILITTIGVASKIQTSITLTSPTSVALLSSDELWVANTFLGTRLFRWASNPQTGVDVEQYNTFKLSGSGSSPLTILDTINNVLVVSNKETLATWNESQLISFDGGISCVSERGYVKSNGQIFFVDYDGLYSFDGSTAPKLLSAKVKPFFTGASKTTMEGAAVGIKGNSILVSLAETTLYNSDGSIFKELENVVLELNLEQNTWFNHTFSLNVESSASSSSSNSLSPSSSLSHSVSSSLSPSSSISHSPSASLSPSSSISNSSSSSLSISSSVSSSISPSPSGSIPSSSGIIKFTTYIAENDSDRLMFCSESGEINEIFKGNADDTGVGCNNFEIPWRVDLSPITLCANWENQAYLNETIVELKSGNGAQLFLDIDYKNEFFPEQGNISKGVSIIKIVPRSINESEVKCRIVTLSLREISTRAIKLSKLKLRYNETSQRIIPNS
jgi:hypothetical protein